jgi:acyl-CoA synthetase
VKQFLTLHHPARARAYYKSGVWAQDTFYTLLSRHAHERPTAIALRDGRVSLTFSQLKLWVDGAAADLRSKGPVEGDRVSIWQSNRAETIVTFLACSREGFACNPSLHRTYTISDIKALLDRLSTMVLVTEPDFTPAADRKSLEALMEATSLRCIYTPASFPKPAHNPTPFAADPDGVRYLAFTSGTTGVPKCVMHSENTLLANARDLVRDWNVGPDTVLLTLSPLSHHIAWVAVAQWLLAGCMLVTDDAPAGTSRLDWIVQTRATYVMGVPTHAIDILAEQRARGAERIGEVRVFYMAGSPIPPVVADAFLKQGITPQNIYGMTENSSHHYTRPGDDAETIIRTCGRGGPAYEVAIFDPADENRRLPAGEIGQIGGRGGALMLGYFDNQSATEKSFNRDGWFMSGDLGSLTPDGALRIEGRLKDLIIRGGHNIYPAHIEALAMRHPKVQKVACFPVADERLGDRACIAVIGDIGPSELIAHLASEGLSKYDMPEYYLATDGFPLTASGKILKRELVEMVRRGDLSPEFVGRARPARAHA